MSKPVIEVTGLAKRYRLGAIGATSLREEVSRYWDRLRGVPHPDAQEFWALRDVSFTVQPGEVVGVIGRNGAGKSTLLKILSRITEPTSGRAVLRGRVASLLEVGTGFHPELTGRENVFLNGAILGMRRDEVRRKFDEIVAFAEVDQFIDTPVKRYSSGMYVRLAFAVAAHLEPEILIIDEVLAVGDNEFQKKCLGKMQHVSQAGRTVLFVSHNMPAIQSLCRRAVVLEKGSISIDADPTSAIFRYVHANSDQHSLKVDLSTHSSRRPNEASALTSVWIENGQGQPTRQAIMGQPVSFCFEFKCPHSIPSPLFGFGVEDAFGKRVFSLNNLMKPAAREVRAARQGIARLVLPQNPLLPGSYFLSISLVEAPDKWIDFVEQAIEFTVTASDVYLSGRIPDAMHGVVYVNGDISVDAS